MKTKSPAVLALACLLSCAIAFPPDNLAAPAQPDQRAGEISRLIPAVNIARGSQSLAAEAKTVVDWQDTVNTQAVARARVALDDGSVLNVGSNSSVRVAKHDSTAQQTDLEVGFGKMRSQAQKISQPNGKFEVHTPAGVAGVVGTHFYVSYENNLMTVIVFEGIVRVCNLAGVCVELNPGQMTTLRNGEPNAAIVPTATPPSTSTDAINSTSISDPPVVGNIQHTTRGTALNIGIILGIVGGFVAFGVAAQGTTHTVTPTPVSKCPPTQCG